MKRLAIFLIVVPLMIGIFLPPVRRSTQGSKPIIATRLRHSFPRLEDWTATLLI
jgi:hypothetical protein